MYERGLEHQADIEACKTSSHMLRHLLDAHEDEEEEWKKIEFGMRVLKSTRTAFERQILESVLIQKSRHHHIMNNKAEYNRCALPRLTAKLGENELSKWREEDRIEMEREASIEEKIRIRKKERSKRRGEINRRTETGQPKRKKKRTEPGEDQHQLLEEEGLEEKTMTEGPKITPASPKKRKMWKEDKKQSKRARHNYDIKKYISCKRWREEQDEIREGVPEGKETSQESMRTGVCQADQDAKDTTPP